MIILIILLGWDNSDIKNKKVEELEHGKIDQTTNR